MKLSLSTFVYVNYALDETIRRVADLGYDGVELWGGRPHAYCDDITPKEARRLRALAERKGVAFSAFIPAQFRYPTCLCSPCGHVRSASVAYIKKSMAAAKLFGCRNVSICPGHTLFGQGYENGRQALAESARALLAFARAEKMSLYLEPAHRLESDLVMTVEEGVRFMHDFSLENLGIVMDTGHCFVNKESLTDCLRLLEGIPYHIHLDDNHGNSDDHKVPGDGGICFEPFLTALDQARYKGFLTAELGWGDTADPDAAASRCKVWYDAQLARLRQRRRDSARPGAKA